MPAMSYEEESARLRTEARRDAELAILNDKPLMRHLRWMSFKDRWCKGLDKVTNFFLSCFALTVLGLACVALFLSVSRFYTLHW